MQQLEDEDELAYVTDQVVKDGGPDTSIGLPTSDGRPAWMRTLHNSATTWLQLLPQSLQTLKRTVENIKDPLYRYFEREVNFGSKLLLEVIHDLNEVVAICQVCCSIMGLNKIFNMYVIIGRKETNQLSSKFIERFGERQIANWLASVHSTWWVHGDPMGV